MIALLLQAAGCIIAFLGAAIVATFVISTVFAVSIPIAIGGSLYAIGHLVAIISGDE